MGRAGSEPWADNWPFLFGAPASTLDLAAIFFYIMKK
jgi:hypothetical protein